MGQAKQIARLAIEGMDDSEKLELLRELQKELDAATPDACLPEEDLSEHQKRVNQIKQELINDPRFRYNGRAQLMKDFQDRQRFEEASGLE